MFSLTLVINIIRANGYLTHTVYSYALQDLSHLIFIRALLSRYYYYPLLQMRKLRHTEDNLHKITWILCGDTSIQVYAVLGSLGLTTETSSSMKSLYNTGNS